VGPAGKRISKETSKQKRPIGGYRSKRYFTLDYPKWKGRRPVSKQKSQSDMKLLTQMGTRAKANTLKRSLTLVLLWEFDTTMFGGKERNIGENARNLQSANPEAKLGEKENKSSWGPARVVSSAQTHECDKGWLKNGRVQKV